MTTRVGRTRRGSGLRRVIVPAGHRDGARRRLPAPGYGPSTRGAARDRSCPRSNAAGRPGRGERRPSARSRARPGPRARSPRPSAPAPDAHGPDERGPDARGPDAPDPHRPVALERPLAPRCGPRNRSPHARARRLARHQAARNHAHPHAHHHAGNSHAHPHAHHHAGSSHAHPHAHHQTPRNHAHPHAHHHAGNRHAHPYGRAKTRARPRRRDGRASPRQERQTGRLQTWTSARHRAMRSAEGRPSSCGTDEPSPHATGRLSAALAPASPDRAARPHVGAPRSQGDGPRTDAHRRRRRTHPRTTDDRPRSADLPRYRCLHQHRAARRCAAHHRASCHYLCRPNAAGRTHLGARRSDAHHDPRNRARARPRHPCVPVGRRRCRWTVGSTMLDRASSPRGRHHASRCRPSVAARPSGGPGLDPRCRHCS